MAAAHPSVTPTEIAHMTAHGYVVFREDDPRIEAELRAGRGCPRPAAGGGDARLPHLVAQRTGTPMITHKARKGTTLAIDPGPTESAYALIDADRRPVHFDKLPNEELRIGLSHNALGQAADLVAIEMVASYGMAVGAEVFETCVWTGRFYEAITTRTNREPMLIKRHPVKLHHCHDSRAKDTNIRQALVDRFAPGQANHGKGTKAQPGWFHGFRADVWAAYALAVYVADTSEVVPPPERVFIPGAGDINATTIEVGELL